MELRLDQAASLRRMAVPAPMIAVASGKGGVGKTFLAINLALALQERGRRCLLVDLDWGLANVDVALGLAPERHVGHVLAGECSLEEALLEWDGLALLPNGCGRADLADLSPARRTALIDAIASVRPEPDWVVLDT